MNYLLVDLFSYSIAFSGIIGLVRFKKIDKAYYPFIYLLWVGLANEFASSLCNKYYKTNVVPSNIYCLSESLLILWFFRNMRLFEKERNFWVLFVLYLFLYGIQVSIFSFFSFTSYYNIIYYFVTVILSIHLIQKLLLSEQGKLVKSPAFLISICFIFYFMVSMITEIFWLYGLTGTSDFETAVYRIVTYGNLAVNLIFILVVLWIPTKSDYTRP